jgi:hypothetical protein
MDKWFNEVVKPLGDATELVVLTANNFSKERISDKTVTHATTLQSLITNIIKDIRGTDKSAQKAYLLSWSLIWPFFVDCTCPFVDVGYRGPFGARIAPRRSPTPKNVKQTRNLMAQVDLFSSNWGRSHASDGHGRSAAASPPEGAFATMTPAEEFQEAHATFRAWLDTTMSAVYIVVNDQNDQESTLEEVQQKIAKKINRIRDNTLIVLQKSLPPEYKNCYGDVQTPQQSAMQLRGEPSLL